MKRGQVYFNHYHDAMGRDRRIPVLVVSPDGYNRDSEFVTCVRLIKYLNGAPRGTHVFIPMAAFTECAGVTECYAVAETISSIRKSNLEGPIGVLSSNYYMSAVCDAISAQIGAAPMPQPTATVYPRQAIQRPTQDSPWYSAEIERVKQMENQAAKAEARG